MAYDTALSPIEEVSFAAWKQKYAPKDSGDDYDLRGAFKAGVTPDLETGHWPDTYKKPNHPTFSNESKYASSAPDKAGSWNGEEYVPPNKKGSSKKDTFSLALDIIGPVKKSPPRQTAVEVEQARIQQERSSAPSADQLMVEQLQSPGNEEQIRGEQRVRGQAIDRRRENEYIQSNREPGVPLDLESGLPLGQRAKISFERNEDKRAEWLAQQEGIDGVRKTKSGDGLIVRVKTEDGSARDILVDERRMTMRDFADMTGDIPQIATQALVAYFTGGAGLVPQAIATATAGAVEGGLQDVAVRSWSGRKVDPLEIAMSRGGQAAFDTALPLIPSGAKRLASAAVGPFAAGVGALERNAKAAAGRLNVPMTAAQLTGNKAVARIEQFTKELPFGTPLVEQAKAQDAAINKVREFLMGGPADQVPTSQEIADRASGALQLEREASERKIRDKSMVAENQSQQSIERLLEQELPGGSITPSQAGSAARSAVIKQRDQFKADAATAYGKVYQLLGTDAAPFVPSTPIKQLVAEISKNSTEATEALMPAIRNILKVGESVPDKMTLPQALELRSVIGGLIDSPEALPGVSSAYRKRLYGAVSEAIEQGVKVAPNPEVGKALADAQALYRDNAWKFEQPGVADLFKETSPGKGFSVGDSDVARRLTAGGGDVDQLKVMGEMLGKNSKEYKGLIRSSVNEMMQDASFGEKYIDAGQFISRLKSMSPEFRKEAIGPIEKELVGDAKVMEILQGRKIDGPEMERILNARPGKVSSTVREIVEEQQAIDKAYNSALMRQLTDGRFSPATFNADDFMTRFVDNASASELKQVLTQLRAADPELPTMIRKRATADLLDRTAREITPDASVAGEVGQFDYQKLLSSLSGPSGEKYKSLLGADVIDTLKDLTTVEASRAKAASMGKQSGQLVYSNILAALMDFKFSEVPRIAKNRVLAGLLTTPGIKTWLTSQTKIPATPQIRKAVMASPPVVRAILEEFADEPDLAGQVLDDIKNSDGVVERPANGADLIGKTRVTEEVAVP